MKTFCVVLVACVMLAGCATRMTVPVAATPDDPAIEYVNRTGAERSAFIRTQQASVLAPRLSMTSAGITVEEAGRDPGMLPLADVRSIQFRDRTRGAYEGAVVGFGVAVAAGITVMIEDRNSRVLDSRRDAFLLSTFIASLVTVPAGAIFGGLIGHRTTITIEPAR